MEIIYNGTLNGRYLLSARSLGCLKSQATKILLTKRTPIDDELKVTYRVDGELQRVVLVREKAWENGKIVSRPWKEKEA